MLTTPLLPKGLDGVQKINQVARQLRLVNEPAIDIVNKTVKIGDELNGAGTSC